MKFCNEGRCKFGKSSNQPLLFFLLILSSERMVNKTNCDMYLDVSSDLVMKRFSTLPIQAISFEKENQCLAHARYLPVQTDQKEKHRY